MKTTAKKVSAQPVPLAPSVFIDEHRATCIRVNATDRTTYYIPMDAAGIKMEACANDTFNSRWTEHLSYPVQRAADLYLRSIAAKMFLDDEAREHLEAICNQRPQPLTKESINMEAQATQSAKSAKSAKPAAPKAPAKPAKAAAPAAPKAPAKPAKAAAPAKPAAPAAPAKAPAKPAKAAPAAPATKGKAAAAAKPAAQRYAGKRIKPLKKEHGAREGTKRQIGMDILLTSKTTDEAMQKFAKYEGIDSSFIRFAVDNGIIELLD